MDLNMDDLLATFEEELTARKRANPQLVHPHLESKETPLLLLCCLGHKTLRLVHNAVIASNHIHG